ncbi:MAG: hypothetical protein HOK28_21725 [Deltaproteobacteria bacterium]|nr:hypothetical protein [Deltaproteobacteria bacterium]
MNFDKDKYKVWQLPHPMVLHWVMNPGLAFNELILGQRLPKVMLVDKTSDAPLMERQYVPCPECNVLTDARVWGGSRSKGHWFGYVCPGCNGRIPCLWNLTSLVLLALTFPLWIWFKGGAEKKLLEREKQRLAQIDMDNLPGATQTSWLKMGITFGVLIFFVELVRDSLEKDLTLDKVGFTGAAALLGGLVFGLLMKLFLTKKS